MTEDVCVVVDDHLQAVILTSEHLHWTRTAVNLNGEKYPVLSKFQRTVGTSNLLPYVLVFPLLFFPC